MWSSTLVEEWATSAHAHMGVNCASCHQTTWAQVTPIANTAAALFYDRLFALDPNIKSLFSTNMAEPGKKLMQMITVAVNGLSQPESLIPIVENLGRRHVGYGVKDEHYDTVGAALLWTLEKGLGERFTPEVKYAWAETYTLLASTMKKALPNRWQADGNQSKAEHLIK